MRLLNKTSYVFFIAIFFGLSISASAQVAPPVKGNTTPTPAEILELNSQPEVYAKDLVLDKTEYKAGDLVKGSFVFVNAKNISVSNLNYRAFLVGDLMLNTLYRYEFDNQILGTIFLDKSENKKIDFEYKLPLSSSAYTLGKQLGIKIRAFSGSGAPLGWTDVKIKVLDSGIVPVIVSNASIVIGNNSFGLNEGPMVYKDGHVFLKMDIKNGSAKAIANLTPKISIYEMDYARSPLSVYSEKKFSLKAKSLDSFSFDLPTFSYTPKVYAGEVVIVDENGINRTNPIKFRYIVYGEVVNIQNVFTSKTSLDKGENFKIDVNYLGSPYDILKMTSATSTPSDLYVKVTNENDEIVSEYRDKTTFETAGDKSVELKAESPSKVLNIEISVSKDGKVVTEYRTRLESKPENLLKNTSNNILSYVISIFILLVVIIVSVFVYRQRKGLTVLILLLGICSGFCLFTNKTEAFTPTSSWTAWGWTSTSVTLNSPKSSSAKTYIPGETFNITGTVYTTTCNNSPYRVTVSTSGFYNVNSSYNVSYNSPIYDSGVVYSGLGTYETWPSTSADFASGNVTAPASPGTYRVYIYAQTFFDPNQNGSTSRGGFSAETQTAYIIGYQDFVVAWPPVTASCAISTSTAQTGQNVTWTATGGGGDGNYAYEWHGDVSGSGSSITNSYNTTGIKQATVSVLSNNSTVFSTNCTVTGVSPSCYPYGASGDKPAAIDFDGDGKADIGAFRVGTADDTLYTVSSLSGQTKPYLISENGANGGDSSFGTLVATGGGGGAGYTVASNGSNGSSGGGAGGWTSNKTGGTGVAGQGYKGGNSVGAGVGGWTAGGGGGGAGTAGANASGSGAQYSSNLGGAGGTGTTSAITGTSLYYAGGGGGSGIAYSGGTATESNSAGGNGGGGSGGVSGTSNTGGGGGARSGAGGSGVVIIRYTPGTDLVGSGSPTGGNISTVGSDKVHVFNTSGTFTVPAGLSGRVKALVVAGGGGGGLSRAGGGGGGGVVYNSAFTVTGNTSYNVVVGNGGRGGGTFSGSGPVNSATNVSSDYDGDGKPDFGIYIPNWSWSGSFNYWSILRSSDNTWIGQQWGYTTDTPVPGDYDGDGKTDIAIYRQSVGEWWIIFSSSVFPSWFNNMSQCSNPNQYCRRFGWSATIPVQGDYDGDGKTDIAVYENSATGSTIGNWYFTFSSGVTPSWLTNTSSRYCGVNCWQFGSGSASIPTPADFDGDGKTDVAVYYPAPGAWYEGYWYIVNSATNREDDNIHWGSSAGTPIPADYDGDGKADLAVYYPTTQDWYIRYSSRVNPSWFSATQSSGSCSEKTSVGAVDYLTVTQAPATPVVASCSVSTSTAKLGDPVTWTASPSGGDGTNYTYNWISNDFSSSLKATTTIYGSLGLKVAKVTVSSGGYSTTTNYCTNSSGGSGVNIVSLLGGINVSISGTGSGTVTSGAPVTNGVVNVNCPSVNCTGSFNLNSSVDLTATTSANGNNYFLGWSGDGVSNTTDTRTLQVTSATVPKNVTANFVQVDAGAPTADCIGISATTTVNAPITWTANKPGFCTVGGTDGCSYAWSGADISGSISTVSNSFDKMYYKNGLKIISVTMSRFLYPKQYILTCSTSSNFTIPDGSSNER